jgi:hemoglobin-like flavoprotein
MNTKQISLVQDSYVKLIPISLQAGELFYNNLFQLDPSLRSLFKKDLKQQGQKLMTMLGTAVMLLGDLDKLLPIAQSLGERHVGYGVKDKHYEIVGEALIDTLAQGLGEDFTSEIKSAWVAVYGQLALVMQQAAKQKTIAV